MILSSAKKRCEIRGPRGQAATPLRTLVLVALRSRAENPFTKNKNKKGDIGSPCHNPLVRVMWPQGVPLIFIE